MKGELQMEPSGVENPSDSDPLLENQPVVDSPSSPVPESSNVIKNDDIEAGAVASCRICLECDGEEGWVSLCYIRYIMFSVVLMNWKCVILCFWF